MCKRTKQKSRAALYKLRQINFVWYHLYKIIEEGLSKFATSYFLFYKIMFKITYFLILYYVMLYCSSLKEQDLWSIHKEHPTKNHLSWINQEQNLYRSFDKIISKDTR